MLLTDLIEEVYREFGDEAGIQITEADVLRWVNMGQRAIVLRNETLLQTETTTNIVAGQTDYSFPATLFILRTVRYKFPGDTSYRRLKGMNMQEFDELIDGWDGDEFGDSDPIAYCIYNSTIKLFPAPSAAVTSGLKIIFSRKPVDVVTSASSIDLPEQYHNALIAYCLQRAYQLDENWEAAGFKGQQLAEEVQLNAERENFPAREYYPTITARDEDYWLG